MERKIGEIFEYNGEWYQCIPDTTDDNCNNCFFQKSCSDITGDCSSTARSDGKSVAFKKLEKVGETFTIEGILYQHYKVFDIDNVCGDGFWCVHNYNAKTLTIEIKQTKEDMEEKEPTYKELLHYYHSTVGLWAIDKSPQEVSLDWICDNAFQLGIDEKHSNSEKIGKNLKPFDLQKAKDGKPVCTRDGRKARIICFDRRDTDNRYIVALIEDEDLLNKEVARSYFDNGKYLSGDEESVHDLMMLPEKKEGWVNVYDDTPIYDTKEEALNRRSEFRGYIDTVKVSWEE